jgi:hypothetical protein
VQLSHFSLEEVQRLAQRYGLVWKDQEPAQKLMDLVGGHPALVQIALYHLSRGEITLNQLLETAATATSIYSHHLQRHRVALEAQPELATSLNTVINAIEPVQLEPILAYKLSSMGLIQQSGDKVTLSYELYRQYFANCTRLT